MKRKKIEREEAEIFERYVETLNRAKSLDKLERLRNLKDSDKSMLFFVAKTLIICIIAIDVLWCIVLPAKITFDVIIEFTIGLAAISLLIESVLSYSYWMNRRNFKNFATPEILEDEQHKDQINEEVKNLSKELGILRKQINQINQELGEIVIKEKLFTDENINILRDYFEEKLQEKNEEAMEKKLWCEKELEGYLNERIDYTDINLEVNPYEKNIHQNCGKNLTKTLFKN